jgi:hypothetical protein
VPAVRIRPLMTRHTQHLMADRFRRGGIYFRRFWWWYPTELTQWWIPRIWHGGDEWCNVPLCLTVPPLGCFLIFWQPMRTHPCDECWGWMDEWQRACYRPGGHLEGGRSHEAVTCGCGVA